MNKWFIKVIKIIPFALIACLIAAVIVFTSINSPEIDFHNGRMPKDDIDDENGIRSVSYEVFKNHLGLVEYQESTSRNFLEDKHLPFEFKPKPGHQKYFYGLKAFLKVKNGWLCAFNRGHYGGSLTWINNSGDDYEFISPGNINYLYQINEEIIAIHTGQIGFIFKVELSGDKWKIKDELEFSESIEACTLTKNDEILIVTENQILSADSDLNLVTLYDNAIWSQLYPNSIVVSGQKIYIGMKNGIFTTKLDDIENYTWLTKD